VCLCDKSYKYRQGLSKHKKKCKVAEKTKELRETIKKLETTIEIFKDNQGTTTIHNYGNHNSREENCVNCTIYLYLMMHGNTMTPIYAGQTTQPLHTRDYQHLRANKTQFDQSYNDKSKYILVVLEKMVFNFIEKAREWMYTRENFYITLFELFNREQNPEGLNCNSG
tara:strand:+ start:208 stop:711 length:504 start_codon:yes stop_codon:yes gene_type:complete